MVRLPEVELEVITQQLMDQVHVLIPLVADQQEAKQLLDQHEVKHLLDKHQVTLLKDKVRLLLHHLVAVAAEVVVVQAAAVAAVDQVEDNILN